MLVIPWIHFNYTLIAWSAASVSDFALNEMKTAIKDMPDDLTLHRWTYDVDTTFRQAITKVLKKNLKDFKKVKHRPVEHGLKFARATLLNLQMTFLEEAMALIAKTEKRTTFTSP